MYKKGLSLGHIFLILLRDKGDIKMNYMIRILILFIIMTTQSRAESDLTLPEKVFNTIVEKIAEITSLGGEEKTSSDRAAQNQADKATSEEKSTKKSAAAKKDKANSTKKVETKPLPEIAIGSKDAPVVMIDYSSLSCGHCAEFHTHILPKIKEKYIDEGQLRVIFRDYPGDQVSLKAHQLAWCKGEIKYLDFLKIIYENQEKWLLDPDPIAALKSIALKNGITGKQFEACLKNNELLDQIISMRLEGQKKYNITATPTIIINAKIYQKALSMDEIDDIMKPLLASSKK